MTRRNETYRANRMETDGMTFGVEIETAVPESLGWAIGPYHRERPITGTDGRAVLPPGWVGEKDGSIRAGRGYTDCEVVSPVLRGADGLREVKNVLEILRDNNAKVNRSCGLHIHIGFDKSNLTNLKRIVHSVVHFERAIYASTGTRSREMCGYADPVGMTERYRSFSHFYGTSGSSCRAPRMMSINVTGSKPTVEIRAFAGTLNFSKVVAYIRMAIGLVSKALNDTSTPGWKPKETTENARSRYGGYGCSHLRRLFLWLGWRRDHRNTVYGYILGEDLPDLDDSVKVLRRLAKKYDLEGGI